MAHTKPGLELIESANEIADVLEGKTKAARATKVSINVRKIRKKLALNRAQLGAMMGVSDRTIENWEQGRRSIPKPVAILMKIAEEEPELVLKYASW